MKKVFLFLAAACIVWVGLFYWKNLRGAGPAVRPAPKNLTDFPLTLPEGFSISVFAKDLGGPRVLAWDPKGTLLVSIPSRGQVVAIPSGEIVVSGLNRPHGIAFHGGKLYIAETDAVAVYDYDGKAKNRKKIIDLPSGGNHVTRTIGFGPDGKLYISIGSSCNVCVEKDTRRGSILVYDGELKPYATGLRNSVFFTWRNGQMWATDMGRDLIGDDIPPEEVNIVREGKHYGWPYCWGKQVADTTFGGTEDFCKTTEPPIIEYQAHAAPLGLAFDKNYLYVAYHGSWNRTVPTGYKIVRFDLKNFQASDFITGWLQGDNALGRPVDLLFDDKGNLYISDDKAGVVYKVTQK